MTTLSLVGRAIFVLHVSYWTIRPFLDCYIWRISFLLIKPVLQALNLTCIVWGDPTPEVSWLKNEKPLASDSHCSLKFESGKTAYLSISGVSTFDSGKYGLVVKNKYGSEISDFTISVFIPEEEARMASEKAQPGTKKSKWPGTLGGRVRGATLSCLGHLCAPGLGEVQGHLRAFHSLFLCWCGEILWNLLFI